MRAHFDHGLTTVCRHGQGEGLTDEVAVPVIVRVNHDHTARTDHLWSGGRDDHFFPVLCVPADVHQLGFARDPLNLGIGDGRAFNRVVDVWAKVLDHGTLFEQIDENGLRDAAVIWGIGEVLPVKITGQANALRGGSHGLREGFDGRGAEVQKFAAVVRPHLALRVLFDGEFDVDPVAVDAPREVDFLAKQALAPGDDVNHGVLRDGTDVPRA